MRITRVGWVLDVCRDMSCISQGDQILSKDKIEETHFEVPVQHFEIDE